MEGCHSLKESPRADISPADSTRPPGPASWTSLTSRATPLVASACRKTTRCTSSLEAVDKCLQCPGRLSKPRGDLGHPCGRHHWPSWANPPSRASCRGHLWCTGGALRREGALERGALGTGSPWPHRRWLSPDTHQVCFRIENQVFPGLPCGAAGRSACSVASGLGPLQAGLSFPTGTDVCLWVSKCPLWGGSSLPSSGAWGPL